MAKVYSKDVSKRLLKSRAKIYHRTSKCTTIKKEDTGSSKKSLAFCNSAKQPSSESLKDEVRFFSVVRTFQRMNFKHEVMHCSQTELTCFYIQNKFMRKFFDCYPEYVCLDILCEIPELDYYVVLFIGLDSNGHCEIVAIGLIKTENIQGFSWFCDMFKKHNPSWKKIEFIISDHNFDNRETLTKAFPEKLIFISFFHSMKAFKRELSSIEPLVTNQDINKALQIFEQMMYVTSESGYTELQKQLKQMSPHIFNLFKKNWHLKKELWALGLYSDSKIVLKSFNSYLLTIRRKLKISISAQNSIETVVQKLCLTVTKIQKDFFQKFTSIFYDPSISYSKVHVMQKYSKFLSPFAIALVNEQLNYSNKIKNVQKIESSSFKINEINVSFTSCSCNFHTLMKLPCSHIFAVRRFLSLPLFVDCFRSSWTSAYYKKTYIDLYSASVEAKYDKVEVIEAKQRFQECIEVSYKLWKQILCCPDGISQERVEVFQNLLKAWKNNFKIDIQVCEKQNCTTSSSVEALENASTDFFKEMYGISLNDILDSENEFSSISVCSEDENELF